MKRAGVFETVIGTMVIIIAGLFMTYAYNVSERTFGRDTYRLDAVFSRVDGVAVGSDVRIAGVKVGAVTANNLDYKTYEANLILSIENSVPIPDDSVAKIVSDGLLGGAHVAIEPGASEELLIAGDKITITQGSVDILNLAVQAFTTRNGPAGPKDDDNESSSLDLDPLGDL